MNVIFSVFSLFLGFVFGNLFGTFLNFFRHFINWDVLIITITILIVEFINYLNYYNKKNQGIPKLCISCKTTIVNSNKNRHLKKQKSKWTGQISNFFSNWFYIADKNYQNSENLAFFDFSSKRLLLDKRFCISCKKKPLNETKKQINFIKILNFYKIGLLLGFFIDAFKVGS